MSEKVTRLALILSELAKVPERATEVIARGS